MKKSIYENAHFIILNKILLTPYKYHFYNLTKIYALIKYIKNIINYLHHHLHHHHSHYILKIFYLNLLSLKYIFSNVDLIRKNAIQ